MSEETKKQLTYADAGVNIDAGNEAVELMKASVQVLTVPKLSVILAVSAVCLP